jgi:hypothetical protein
VPRKLKVFRTPAGFHDAYVAAPSRKAALAAWGADADLFARGVAEEVTDAALMEEPLARPGEVVKRSRGSAAEQLAALPDAPEKKQAAKKPTAKPKPRRDALDAAEQALEDAQARQRAVERELAERQEALDREKRAAAKSWARERARLEEARDTAAADYDAALERWRG